MESSLVKSFVKLVKKIGASQHDSDTNDKQFNDPVNYIFTRNGVLDYNDLATITTPFSVTVDTLTDIPNDGEGPFSNKQFLPAGVTDTWNVSAQEIDLSQLQLGTIVGYRLDMLINVADPNQEVVLELHAGLGVSPYVLQIARNQYKSAGQYPITASGFMYIGNELTKDNPAKFKIISDGALTLENIGFATVILNR